MQTIEFIKDGALGYLVLKRNEKYNAVNSVMLDELTAFWNGMKYDRNTRVIIFHGGQAKGFCAGLDIGELGGKIFSSMDGIDAYDAQVKMSRLLLLMRQAPQPIICCVKGAAAGLGFSFAMAADIRIITPDARFSAAYINIGLGGADMASSYFLPRLIGSGKANEYLLTGNWMNSDEAVKTGFAGRMVPEDELLASAKTLADVMITKDPLGLRMTKEAINMNIDAGSLEAAINMEDRNQMMALFSKTFNKKS